MLEIRKWALYIECGYICVVWLSEAELNRGDTTMEPESALQSSSLAAKYWEFLMTLSYELTKDNIDSLKFIAPLPSRWLCCLFNRIVLPQNASILRKSIDCCFYVLFNSLLIHCWKQPGRVVGAPDLKSGDPELKSSSDHG